MKRFQSSVVASNGYRFASALSAFDGVPTGPPDPILGLSVAFNADQHPNRVNLGVGVYRGDDNKPFILQCVRKAEEAVFNKKFDHEYCPITGLASFVTAAQDLAFANSVPKDRLASSQTLSGTGALRVGGDFLARFYGNKNILLPNPSWGNHANVFKDAKMQVGKYSYYNPDTRGINFNGLLKDLDAAEEGSVVLLHACAHNPTGVDPTQDQWKEIASVMQKRNHFPYIDMAYQGFASGDPERDAFALRHFAQAFPSLVVSQSFAKSFGLYGQRIGAVHLLTKDKDTAEKVLSQLKILIRPMYSNPPIHGARLVSHVLNTPELKAQWMVELKDMAGRMQAVRTTLVTRLKEYGSTKDWSHIVNQIGMMAFTGLSKEQVARLKSEFHVYLTDDGRAAISGLNSTNVDYVARSFHEVSK